VALYNAKQNPFHNKTSALHWETNTGLGGITMNIAMALAGSFFLHSMQFYFFHLGVWGGSGLAELRRSGLEVTLSPIMDGDGMYNIGAFEFVVIECACVLILVSRCGRRKKC
jgi:hypothetical protein